MAGGDSPVDPTLDIPGVELQGLLGRGGYAAVFRGRHRALDVPVAVKLLVPAVHDPVVLSRALNEARIMARLDHPNLLRVLDAGQAGDKKSAYLVLELMDGGSLEGEHGMDGGALADVARQLLGALQALHEARILHRDVKPANCLRRTSDGRIKLSDLGVARSDRGSIKTDSKGLAGTLPFLAPELLETPPRYGAASDLYALGLTLSCLGLEEDPLPRGGPGDIIAWIREAPRPTLRGRPGLDPSLVALVDRLVDPDPDRRPASAQEAMAMMQEPSAPGTTTPPREGPSLGGWVLGDVVVEHDSWTIHAATHVHTGAAARLGRLRAEGVMSHATELILDCAARASAFEHPCILPVLDWGTDDAELAWLVTSAHGRPVGDIVAAGPVPEVDALAFGIQLCDALAYLHERGVVHQVVNPTAVYTSGCGGRLTLGWPIYCVAAGSAIEDGRVQRVLVPLHAAPEALVGRRIVDHAVDLYGLGEVLFTLLTGRAAFAEAVRGGGLVAAKMAAPPSPRTVVEELSAPTDRIVRELLAPLPEHRPASARAVGETLTRIHERLGGG